MTANGQCFYLLFKNEYALTVTSLSFQGTKVHYRKIKAHGEKTKVLQSRVSVRSQPNVSSSVQEILDVNRVKRHGKICHGCAPLVSIFPFEHSKLANSGITNRLRRKPVVTTARGNPVKNNKYVKNYFFSTAFKLISLKLY